MDAVLMCGGPGTRLDTTAEKPLVAIDGIPMINRVLSALEASSISSILTVTTAAVPETSAFLETNGYDSLDAPGDGYVPDLEYALDHVTQPVLTTAADLPLLHSHVIDEVIDGHNAGSLTVAVPLAVKHLLGVSSDTTLSHHGREVAPSGVNIVSRSPSDSVRVSYDIGLAVNVNYPGDRRVAERLA